MSVDFGTPPEGDNIRSLVEERLKQVMAEHGAKVTVDWRGEQRHLHVISMPVDMLYFNPDTHRIRAQRTLDPQRNRTLEEKPWSEAAQQYLHHLLTRKPSNPDQVDPDYTALMEELEDFGQKEPGIVSRLGILVDGNTDAQRCGTSALRTSASAFSRRTRHGATSTPWNCLCSCAATSGVSIPTSTG